MKYGIITKITHPDKVSTQFKFRNRYYTAFARMFIVAGRWTQNDCENCCKNLKHYMLTDMNIDCLTEGKSYSMYKD